MNRNFPIAHSETQDITILVPTRKRPEMLRSCLQSIAMQSRKERIKTVLVSENSYEDQSRLVAREFSNQLPITYVQQKDNWTAQEHGIWLAHQVSTKYVAQIADDDMWARYHLEEALRCFEAHPSLCAFFGQTVVVENTTCHPLWRFSGSFLQIPDSISSQLADFRIWNMAETAINCIANTPLNIWAAVVLADVHREAIESSAGDPAHGNYPSNDRLYIWRLSLHGNIGIGRNISLFYRWHPASDIQQHMNNQWHELLHSDLLVSKEIERQARMQGIDAYQGWHDRFRTVTSHGLMTERIDLWNPEIKSWLLDGPTVTAKVSEDHVQTPTMKGWKKNVYLLCPPLLLETIRKVKSKMQPQSQP